MTLHVDGFWSFRSPYSYLATPRLVELQQRYDLEIALRVVLPIAVRVPGFFDRVNPLWPPYVLRDTARLAEFLGLPYRWPRPDPIVQTVQDGRLVTAEEQPYIHRLSRLGVLAEERGRGLAFARSASARIFGGVEDWHRGGHLAEAAAEAGLDLADLDAAAEAEAGRLDGVLAANQEALERAGHWGVPTLVFEGEPFFGQDRIDLLVWRLRQHGLAERTGPRAASTP
ncbi:MAG: DsbA family protein [Myxococcota bacterium]|nr:DsbA family protein [Myxococcota bacterium]